MKKCSRRNIGCLAVAVIAGVCAAPSAFAQSVVGWGLNQYGDLGNGTTTNSSVPVPALGLPAGVSAIANGAEFTLALNNGALNSWGLGFDGELGDNSTATDSTVPVAVSGLSSGVTAIAGGALHGLAVHNGALYAWGYNNDGQLGNNSTTNTSVPVAVSAMSSGVTAVAGGQSSSFAIQNGGVFAWGYNGAGNLGNNSNVNSSVPVAVTGLSSGVTAIASGDYFSLAIKGGGVYAWGAADLGNGSGSGSEVPVAVSALSSGVTAIAAGGSSGNNFSLAVQGGRVYAWGANYEGRLGDGTTTTHLTPEQIDPADLTNIISVAANLGGSSAYALSSDGSIWDWGYNGDGELGIGTTTRVYETPQHLLPPPGYAFTTQSPPTSMEPRRSCRPRHRCPNPRR